MLLILRISYRALSSYIVSYINHLMVIQLDDVRHLSFLLPIGTGEITNSCQYSDLSSIVVYIKVLEYDKQCLFVKVLQRGLRI